MLEVFKIYIDRLRDGEAFRLEGSFAPAFLEIEEPELRFRDPVAVKAEAYIADGHLIIHLTASALAEMPCAVCNETTKFKLSANNFYHTESLDEVPSAIYDLAIPLREALLIELPRTAECRGGKCPARATMTPYMREERKQVQATYFPFADLEDKT